MIDELLDQDEERCERERLRQEWQQSQDALKGE